MLSQEDERVVSLSFDNKNFEKNAKESMSTLDKLKEKLMFKNVKEDSKDTLNSILNAVETVATKSYSIVDRMLDKMKDSISTKLVSTLRETTIDPVSAGWSKFGDKTRSVGTLIAQGYDLDTVTEQLELLNTFTDETSYNFTDMVGNIAKFTATGQKLDDSVQAMMGIANWAALSGQNAQTASRAMYQLSQAMGKGVMKSDDWRSINDASMATAEFKTKALEAAEAIGTVKKNADGTWQSLTGRKQQITISNFDSTLTDNLWFTKEVMMEVYNTYASAFNDLNNLVNGEDAVYDTFSLAIEAVTESNEELRKSFIKTYGVSEDKVDDILTEITKVDEVTEEAAKQLAETYKLGSKFDTEELKKYTQYVSEFGIKAFSAGQEARTLGDAIDSIKDAVSTTWMNIFETVFGAYDKAKALWTDLANGLFTLFQPLFDLQEAFAEWADDDGIDGRDTLFKGIYAIANAIKKISEGIHTIFSLIFTNPAVKKLTSISNTVQKLGYEFYIFISTLSSEEGKFFENIGNALNNILTPIKFIYNTFKSTFKEVFPITRTVASVLTDLAKRFLEFSRKFIMTKDTLADIRSTIKGIWSALSLIKKIIMVLWNGLISPFIDFLTEKLGNVFKWILQLTGAIGEWVTELDQSLGIQEIAVAMGEKLGKALSFVSDVMTTIARTIKRIFGPAISWIVKQITGLNEEVDALFNPSDKDAEKSPLMQRLNAFIDKLKESWEGLSTFSEIIDTFKSGSGFFNFVKMVGNLLDNVVQRIGLTVDALIGSAEVLSENKAFQSIVSVFRSIWNGLKWLYTNLIKPVLIMIAQTVKATALDIFTSLQNGNITEAFEKINKVLTSGVLFRLYKMLSGVRTIIGGNGILGVLTQTRNVLKSYRKYMDAKTLEVYSSAILKIVKAIALLFGVLVLVALIPEETLSKMWRPIAQFGVLLGVVVVGLIGIAGAARLAQGAIFGVATTFIGFGAAMLMIISSVLLVMNVMISNEAAFKKALDAVKEIMELFGGLTSLALFSSKFSKNQGQQIMGLGLVIMGIAAVILAFAVAVEKIDGIKSGWSFLGALLAVIALFVTVTLAMRWMIGSLKQGADWKSGIAAMLSIIGIASVMTLIVVPVLKDLANDASIDWGSMFAAVGWISLAMVAFGSMFALMNKFVNGSMQMLSTAISFWGVCKVLTNIVIPAIKQLSESKWEVPTDKLWALGLAAVGISVVMLAIGGAVKLATSNLQYLKKGQLFVLGAAIAAFFYVIGAIVLPAVEQLNSENWQGVIKYVVVAVVSFGAILATLQLLKSYIDDYKYDIDNSRALALMIASVAALFVAIGSSLVPSVQTLKDVDLGEMIKYVITAIAPLGLLLYGIYKIANNAVTDYRTVIALVSGLSAILLIIGLALVPSLGNIGEGILNKLTAAASVCGMIWVTMHMVGKLATDSTLDSKKTIVLMAGLAVSLLIIGTAVIPAMSTLASANTEALLVGGLTTIGMIWTLFKTFENFTRNIRYVDGKKATENIVNQILAVGSVVVLLTTLAFTLPPIIRSFNTISEVPWKNILMAGVAVTGFTAALIYLSKNANGIKFLEIAAGIAIIAVSIAALISAIQGFYRLANDSGKELSEEINEGVQDGSKIASPSKVMQKNGKFIAQGLIKGMKKESKNLYKGGVKMADNIDDGVTDELEIHSPSKVMYENGRYVVIGLANGMSSYESKKALSNSASTLADTIGSSVGTSVSEALSNTNVKFDIFDGKEIDEVIAEYLGGDDLGSVISEAVNGDDGFVTNITNSITSGFGGITDDLTNKVSEFGKNILDGLASGDVLKKAGEVLGLDPDDKSTMFGKIIAWFKGEETTEELAEGAGNWLSNALQKVLGNLDLMEKAKSVGQIIGESVLEGIGNSLSSASNGLLNLVTLGLWDYALEETDQKIQEYQKEQKEYTQKQTELATKYVENQRKSRESTINGKTSAIYSLAKKTTEYELLNPKKVNLYSDDELAKMKKTIVSVDVSKFQFSIKDKELYDTKKDSEQFGMQLAKWIAAGYMKLDTDGVYRFAKNIDENIKAQILKDWGIASPSKFMSNYVMKHIYGGIKKGVDMNEDSSFNYVTRSMETLKSDISDSFMGIDLLADPNYKVKTTIIPVVDTSGIQNGVVDFNSIITNTTNTVTSQIAKALGSKDTMSEGFDSLVNAINTKVNEAIAAVYASASQTNVDVNVNANKDDIFDVVVNKTKEFKLRTGRAFSW